jgi:CDP-diacylglycerol--serine O-phosphatidyltransferase
MVVKDDGGAVDASSCDGGSKLSTKKTVSLVKILPSVVTISAFCFGLTGIRFALFHKWELAVLCVCVSALLDAFDGWVARLLGQSSQFGAELDSLSDLVCFGVAPAMILFLKSMYFMDEIGWGICMFFTVCCGLRLARFNATLNVAKPEWTKKYFTGVPAPAGAILGLFPIVLFFATGNEGFLAPGFVAFCLLSSGVLMISTVKNFSSKMIEIKNGLVSPELLVMSTIVICLITAVWVTLSILTILYILAIPYGAYYYSKVEREKSAEAIAVE